jgi:cytochrome c biogenesis protein
MDAFFIVVRNQKTGMEQAFRVPPEQDVAWQGTDVSFRIEELRKDQDGAVDEAKIRFMTEGADEPSLFWMQDKTTTIVQQIGGDLSFSFRQLYSTLFLVTRDPGVWIVYSGFMLIIAGLAVSFFLSHRRIWVYISPKGKRGSRILVCGVANKHKPVFERKFQKIVSLIAEDDAFFAGNESKL